MPAATVHHSQRICEVWACNVDEEMKKIRQVIRKYNYVAMDTEGMFFEDHTDDAKYCGHLYGLGSGSSYVQNGTGNAYEEEANKQS
uniref:CNOT7 n=1 Tax=Pongo abelii TaxID=9601 RepID=A0A8I5TTY6_PONAB